MLSAVNIQPSRDRPAVALIARVPRVCEVLLDHRPGDRLARLMCGVRDHLRDVVTPPRWYFTAEILNRY